jgi:hypothetical protein
MAAPSLLPSSRRFVDDLRPRVERAFGISSGGSDEDALQTLEELADQAEGRGVFEAFQELVLAGADFCDAPPNFGHRALGVLLREGASTVFTTNWDRCIEHGSAAIGFHVDVTITEADRAHRFARARYHKVHGCASQPASLLISTRQLDEPPDWVQHEIGAALGTSTLVFVGLGTVGGYVRRRVSQVIDAIGNAAPIWVADPDPSETWQELLERAGEGHILEVDSNSFFDHLLRAFVREMLAHLVVAAREMDAVGWDPPLQPIVERLEEALDGTGALETVDWLRNGAGGVPGGTPFVHSRECRDGLLAVAATVGEAHVHFGESGDGLVLRAGSAFVELSVWPEVRSDVAIARERARTLERHDRGCYDNPALPIYHVCVGQRGPLPGANLHFDIGGASVPGDLIEGEPQHYWVAAESVLQGQAMVRIPA